MDGAAARLARVTSARLDGLSAELGAAVRAELGAGGGDPGAALARVEARLAVRGSGTWGFCGSVWVELHACAFLAGHEPGSWTQAGSSGSLGQTGAQVLHTFQRVLLGTLACLQSSAQTMMGACT